MNIDIREVVAFLVIVFVIGMACLAIGRHNPHPLHIEQINSAIKICTDANSELEYIQGKTIKCKNGLSMEMERKLQEIKK